MAEKKAKINIARVLSNYKDPAIEIKIIDDDFNILFEGQMTLNDFACAITGQCSVNIKVIGDDNGRK